MKESAMIPNFDHLSPEVADARLQEYRDARLAREEHQFLHDEAECAAEHDPGAWLDDQFAEFDPIDTAATIDPAPSIETPIVAELQPAKLVGTVEWAAIEVSDDILQAVHYELEAEETATALGGISDTDEHKTVDAPAKSIDVSDDDEDSWDQGREIWHRTVNRINDKPDEIVANIRRTAPAYCDAVETFLAKRNKQKAKDKEFDRTVGHILGGKKRKARWAVESPPELRAERKTLMARERKRRERAAKRAGTT